MPNPGSQPANSPVIRLVKAILIFASHLLRNRIIRVPVAEIAMARIATTLIYQNNSVLRFGSYSASSHSHIANRSRGIPVLSPDSSHFTPFALIRSLPFRLHSTKAIPSLFHPSIRLGYRWLLLFGRGACEPSLADRRLRAASHRESSADSRPPKLHLRSHVA